MTKRRKTTYWTCSGNREEDEYIRTEVFHQIRTSKRWNEEQPREVWCFAEKNNIELMMDMYDQSEEKLKVMIKGSVKVEAESDEKWKQYQRWKEVEWIIMEEEGMEETYRELTKNDDPVHVIGTYEQVSGVITRAWTRYGTYEVGIDMKKQRPVGSWKGWKCLYRGLRQS